MEQIEFDPTVDILYGSDATAMQFERKLVDGRYRIIHFAGHAYYELRQAEILPEVGLAMFDPVLAPMDIKEYGEGPPILIKCLPVRSRCKR